MELQVKRLIIKGAKVNDTTLSISPTDDDTKCEKCKKERDDVVCIGLEIKGVVLKSVLVCTECLTEAVTDAVDSGETTNI